MHSAADCTEGVYAYDHGVIRRLSVVVMLLVALAACGGGNKGNDGANDEPSSSAVTAKQQTGAPPWPLGDNQAQRMVDAGQPQLRSEGSVVHYHAHLDVFYNGETVLVPAGIGIDLDKEVISPLHTHQPSGIVHVEAEKDTEFNVAQLLTEWGVKPDLAVKVYVNGDESPRGLGTVIRGNTEIALVFGTPPAQIPSTYDCSRSPSDACDKIPQP